MRKCVCLLMICVFFTACASEETFETISDELILDAAVPVREILLSLPEEAAVPVSQTDTGALYHCEGYELMLQTLSGGDLDATIRDLTGFSREDTSLMQTAPGDYKRYALWLVTARGVVNTHVRDEFSAGGQVMMQTPSGTDVAMPATFGRIRLLKDRIQRMIRSEEADVLKEYWQCAVLPADRMAFWCDRIADSSKGNTYMARMVLRQIFHV